MKYDIVGDGRAVELFSIDEDSGLITLTRPFTIDDAIVYQVCLIVLEKVLEKVHEKVLEKILEKFLEKSPGINFLKMSLKKSLKISLKKSLKMSLKKSLKISLNISLKKSLKMSLKKSLKESFKVIGVLSL